jgi:outer membrane protein assembly factor BamE (lipoprotein component of BamABCDE complex)
MHSPLEEIQMRNVNRRILEIATATLVLVLSALTVSGQKARANTAALAAPEQPLFSEYKGIHLGMTTDEVRAKLGNPTLKGDDQDYYVFSERESAQFAYDATHKVVTISIDYTGAGAPDYRNVIGPSIDQREDGSLYKLVRYEAEGFWVCYSRTAGAAGTVTITIQKIRQVR